jgi:hypothetical protein
VTRLNGLSLLSRMVKHKILVISIAGLAGFFNILIAVTHGGPVAVPDVPAYLSISQWLAGGFLPDELPYYPGYGYLLSPFAMWGLGGNSLHTCALIVNAVISSCVILCAAKYAAIHKASGSLQLWIAGGAAVFPTLTAASRIAWPEALLTLIVVSVAILFTKFEPSSALLIGLLSGIAVGIHSRGFVILIGAVLAVSVIVSSARELGALVAGLVTGLSLSVIMLSRTKTWPNSRLDAASQMPELGQLLTSTIGQILALSAGTFGLTLIGAMYLSSNIKISRFRSRANQRIFGDGVFLLGSVISMVVLGGWVLAGSNRADTLLYSRYIEPWVIPLAIAGAIAVRNTDFLKKIRSRVFFVMLLCSLVISIGALNQTEDHRRIMTLSIGWIWHLFAASTLVVVLVTVASLAVALFVIFGSNPNRHKLIAGLFFVICVSSSLANHSYLSKVGNVSQQQGRMASSVAEDETCLSHDDSVKPYSLWLYQLELPLIKHKRVNISNGEKLCGRHLIANISSSDICPEAEFIGKEPKAKWGLWKYPSQGCD